MAKPGKKFKLKKKKMLSIPGLSRDAPPEKSTAPEPEKPAAPSVDDPDVAEVLYYIGDTPENYRVAKDVVRLRRTAEPNATLPEALTHVWLQHENIPFLFQPPVLGGYVRGGLIPDFIVGSSFGGLAWLIQGEYYHGQSFQMRMNQYERDARADIMLRGRVVQGVLIRAVVQIDEADVYIRRDKVLQSALSGVEL